MTIADDSRYFTDLHQADVITRRQFEMLVLRYVHQASLSQIALALDVSRSTVQSTLRRAGQKIELHNRTDAA